MRTNAVRTYYLYSHAPRVSATPTAGAVSKVQARHGATTLTALNWTNANSTRWAGFVLHGLANYRLDYVNTDITIPRVTCAPRENSLISIWAGLGGDGPKFSVPQAGISEGCANGHLGYVAWDEWYEPKKGNHALNVKGLRVVPGDSMEVTVALVSSTEYSATFFEWDSHDGNQEAYKTVDMIDPPRMLFQSRYPKRLLWQCWNSSTVHCWRILIGSANLCAHHSLRRTRRGEVPIDSCI